METVWMEQANGSHYQDRHLDIDFGERSARVDFRPVRLTRKEYELLEYLIRNAGDVVRSDVLLAQVFGYCPEARTRTLHVHIRRLRKKLDMQREQYIETIFGVGYRFQPCRPAGRPPEQVELM
jgi:DNA-binding response OmpR family regulator